MSTQSALGRPSSGKRRLKDLQLKSENRVCADCGAPDPKWASANIGVFICLKCCGVHRSLGTHISKVLSVTLDDWSEDEIDAMIEVGGNNSVNSIYEAYLPEGVTKPRHDSSHDERSKFIRSKYELQEFLKPSLKISSTSSASSGISTSLQSITSGGILDILKGSTKLEGMIEFIGLLKVKVVKGTNLAVRDMFSSDPYVILTLGQQIAQTNIVKSNANPVWDEDLMLSVPKAFRPLKLEVYDHDMFSKDDIIGEAEIDLHQMITSATTYGDPGMFADMQIGKWLKSHDNALIEDSIVNIIDGKVKQDISLKLQNVESGEIFLELQWMALE